MINHFPVNISREEISKLPLTQFSGNIIVADNQASFRNSIKMVKEYNNLGFDTETRPSFKKGNTNNVAMIQLATKDKCFIFRLNKIGLRYELIHLLSDKKKLKVGVSLRDDTRLLRKLKYFEPRGFIDLQNYAEQFGIKDKSLKNLTAIILDKRISKSQQTSNWEVENLSQYQLIYAATDAWVCLEIYNCLKMVESEYEGIGKSNT
jgi:ribonuclease D